MLPLTIVIAPLAVTAPAAAAGVVGQAFTYSAQATGGTGVYTWSVASGSLPEGLSLNSATGVLSGTLHAAGQVVLSLAVQDTSTPVQKQMVPVTVSAIAPALAATPAGNKTWYVRQDGGTRYSSRVTSGQCDGLGDGPYPGKGVNQHCAFNDIRLLWQDGSYAYSPDYGVNFPGNGWVGQGGDTYIIRGSIAAGTPAYRIGWSSLNGNGADPAQLAVGNPAPYRGWPGDQYYGAPTPPAGTPQQHTRILGENFQNCHTRSARTPVISGNGVGAAFRVSSSYVDFQCFDISDKADCVVSCIGQDFGTVGIAITNTADHLLLQDLRIHGMQTFGLYGPSGDGDVFRYISLVGNGGGGWNADAGDGTTGTGSLLVQNYEILWNGCGEEYPIVDAVPYHLCRDQSSGGYGDGFGTATVTSNPGWQAHFDQGTVAYNTQDGLDALHLIGNGSSMTVTRTLAYGNMGQQVKVGGAAGALENSVIVGNCDAMSYPITGAPSNYNQQLSNFCRAGNQVVLMTAGHGTTTSIRHNTIEGRGALLIGYVCDGSGGNCDSTALVDLRDNILLGNPDPIRGNPGANYLIVIDGSYTSAAACNAAADGHHSWTTDGAVGCNNDVFYNQGSFNSNNIYYNVKDRCTDNNGVGNLCMSPGLNSLVVPNTGYPDLTLSSQGSAAFQGGLTIPAISSDYSGLAFHNPPSIGALEQGSKLTPWRGEQ